MALGRIDHRLVVPGQGSLRPLVHVVEKPALGDVQPVLVVYEDVVGAVEERPLAQVFAPGIEDLHARVLAIGHVHQPRAVHRDAVRQDELAGTAARLAPGEQQLPVRGKLVDAGVAVAVGDVELAPGQHGDVGDAVEGPRCPLHGADADLVAGIRRSSRLAERHQLPAVGRELVDGVVLVVSEPQVVVAVDEDAVGILEQPFAPGTEELPFLVEHDHGMRAAVEHVHAVARVARDARNLDVTPAFGQPVPSFQHFVLNPVFTQRHISSSRTR